MGTSTQQVRRRKRTDATHLGFPIGTAGTRIDVTPKDSGKPFGKCGTQIQAHGCPFWLIWLKNRGRFLVCLVGQSTTREIHLFSQKGHLCPGHGAATFWFRPSAWVNNCLLWGKPKRRVAAHFGSGPKKIAFCSPVFPAVSVLAVW